MKYLWTAYCSMPDDKRGEYSEEIDIEADTATYAKQKAEVLISADYVPELKVRQVIRRIPIYLMEGNKQ